MTTAALDRLREANPRMHVTLLTPEKLSGLWEGQPFIDELLSFTGTDGVGAVCKKLKAGSFDAALILPNSFRAAFESWLAAIPSRIGYAGRGRRLLLTRVVSRRPDEVKMRKRTAEEVRSLIEQQPQKQRDVYPSTAHQIHDYLRLAATFGGDPAPLAPKIVVSESERASVRIKFSLPTERLIGLNPGAEYGPAKRWPIEYFVETVRLLNPRFKGAWLIAGGPGDVQMGETLEKGIRSAQPAARVINMAGRTTLKELKAVLSLCDWVLTNDTGPMHLAAAVGAHVVVPFGSTSPELTGPGLPNHTRNLLITGQAACAPCFLRECPIDFRCMRSITPDLVAGRIGRAFPD